MSRFASCQFCDDVRVEIGNKISLMGIYGGELAVAGGSTVLARLCVVATAFTTVDQPFKSLRFRVTEAGRIVAEQEIPSATIKGAPDIIRRKERSDDPILRYSLSCTMFISPFVVDRDMVIKVIAICDGEEIGAGRLYCGISPETRNVEEAR
jgi:hypothetical protein